MEAPHEDEIKSYFVVVMKLITEFSFGSKVYADPTLVQALTRSLPLIYFEILRRQYHDINIKIVVNVVRGLIDEDISLLKKEDEKRLAFEVAFIMMFNFIHKNQLAIDMYDDVEAMLGQYPDFKGNTDVELTKLLAFANVMKVALHTVPAKNHKNHLLDVVTRITEGREIKYVTGSGQTVATARRVQIYEHEGNIKPLPRPPRKANPAGSSSSSSSSQNQKNLAIGAVTTTGSGSKRKIEVGAFNTLYEDLCSTNKRIVNDEGFPVRSASISYDKTEAMQRYMSSDNSSDADLQFSGSNGATSSSSYNNNGNILLSLTALDHQQQQQQQFGSHTEFNGENGINNNNNNNNNIYVNNDNNNKLYQQQQHQKQPINTSQYPSLEIHQQQPFSLLDAAIQQQQQQQNQQQGYYNLNGSGHSHGNTNNSSSHYHENGISSSSGNNVYQTQQQQTSSSLLITIVDSIPGIIPSSSTTTTTTTNNNNDNTSVAAGITATTTATTNADNTRYISSGESVAGFSVQSHLDLFDDLIWDNDYQI